MWKAIGWYLLVIVSTILLFLSFLLKDWLLTIVSMILVYILSKTNKNIKLPEVYQELGVRNELFENKRTKKENI